ncbi:hypothetical protein F4677DRAFT_92278 [Hypoxylon crocopeplum]|nr:hypothetical protein F4677DRAFT_92278 [Hypoxylon crocopeplum]
MSSQSNKGEKKPAAILTAPSGFPQVPAPGQAFEQNRGPWYPPASTSRGSGIPTGHGIPSARGLFSPLAPIFPPDLTPHGNPDQPSVWSPSSRRGTPPCPDPMPGNDNPGMKTPKVVLPPPGNAGQPFIMTSGNPTSTPQRPNPASGSYDPGTNAVNGRASSFDRETVMAAQAHNGNYQTQRSSDFVPSRRQVITDSRQVVVSSPTFKNFYTPMQSRGNNTASSNYGTQNYDSQRPTGNNYGSQHPAGQQYGSQQQGHIAQNYGNQNYVSQNRGGQKRGGRNRADQNNGMQNYGSQNYDPTSNPYHKQQQQHQARPDTFAAWPASQQGRQEQKRPPPMPPADRIQRQAIYDERMKSFDEEDDAIFYPNSK